MHRRNLQDVPNITMACIAGSHGIGSIRSRYLSLWPVAKFHNHLSLGIESMHVAGLMIFRICYKPNPVEPNRTHVSRIL